MALPLELSDNLGKTNKIILVEDSACSPGRGIILAQSLLSQLKKSHPSAKELVVSNEISWLFDDKLEIVDAQALAKHAHAVSCPNLVILLSLTPFLFENSMRNVTQLLHALKADTLAVIAVVHGDCHSSTDIDTLQCHSDLWLKIANADYSRTCLTKTHSRGKVERQTLDITVKNREMVAATSSKSPETTQTNPEGPVEVMPQSSFNLTLSQKEKDDRKNLELPFWKDSSQKESKIEYVPDENDDWDDEDPDEDLDF